MLQSIRLVAALLLAASWPLAAASFTANSSLDLPDDNPGDGLCRSALMPPSVCTLRAAIMEANALPGNHFILLQSGRTYTLTRSGVDDTALNGDLDISSSMTISCFPCTERSVLNVNGVGRGFDIHAGNVTLYGFDITGADATLIGENQGGAVLIRSTAGNVRLGSMHLYGNQAAIGGAIRNLGATTKLDTSEVFDNYMTDPANHGSAISNANVMTIQQAAIFGNSGAGPMAAAIHTWNSAINLPGHLLMQNSTVSGNLGSGLMISNSLNTVLENITIAGHDQKGLMVTGTNPGVTMHNSLVVRNANGDCQFNDANGSYIASYNLFTDSSCSKVSGTTSLHDTDPLLTPLKRRYPDGSTPVHWPRVGSPAFSSGSVVEIGHPGGSCLNNDQNGRFRPKGFNGVWHCDIGAAEVHDDAIFFDSLETL